MRAITRTLLLLWTCLVGAAAAAEVEERLIALDADDEISVDVLRGPEPARLLAIWLLDHGSHRPAFEAMLQAQADAGVEVWRVDLLGELFLERDNETVRTLEGDAVAALIDAAHRHSELPIVLASYDRMALPLLRGVRLFQLAGRADNRFDGSLLYYPNLFGPTPQAGVAPSIDPIVAASNYPLAVIQPELGTHRWRMQEVMQQFWAAGSPASLVKVAGARDWFFMGSSPTQEDREDPARDAAVANMPRQVLQLAGQLARAKKPAAAVAQLAELEAATPRHGPQQVHQPKPAPALSLQAFDGEPFALASAPGRVMLLSFWATWCPPCVEELPSMNALAADYAADDFAIVSVNFQESRADIEDFLKRVEVDFPILLDPDGSASRDWGVFSFPSSFLLDRQGRVRYTLNKAIDWHTPEIKALLDALVAER